jgi:hypothetical protein
MIIQMGATATTYQLSEDREDECQTRTDVRQDGKARIAHEAPGDAIYGVFVDGNVDIGSNYSSETRAR